MDEPDQLASTQGPAQRPPQTHTIMSKRLNKRQQRLEEELKQQEQLQTSAPVEEDAEEEDTESSPPPPSSTAPANVFAAVSACDRHYHSTTILPHPYPHSPFDDS